MGRKSTPLTILKNEGTSEIFFEIVRSKKDVSPKDIKANIEISNSSISEQLGRLYRASIIKFKTDPRDKRNKYYYVDWDKFTEIICDYYKKESDLLHSSTCKISTMKFGKVRAIELLERIKLDAKFVVIIKKYFIGFVENIDSANRITEALASFEEDLLFSKIKLDGELGKWQEVINSHYSPRKDLFEESIN